MESMNKVYIPIIIILNTIWRFLFFFMCLFVMELEILQISFPCV